MNKLRFKFGFTLAEVLVTLVIIGVIAAVTIPNLVRQTNYHEYRSSLKKSFSALSNALERHYVSTGENASDYSSSEELVDNVFKKNMVIVDEPAQFTSDDCTGSTFITHDGVIFCIQNFNSQTSMGFSNICDFGGNFPCVSSNSANIWIDVNGLKKPNKLTLDSKNPKDIYLGQIYADKVLPYGNPTIEFLYEIKQNSSTVSPSEPTEPTNPTQPTFNPDDITPDDLPENHEDLYDPNIWDSFLDFLRWLWRLLFGP